MSIPTVVAFGYSMRSKLYTFLKLEHTCRVPRNERALSSYMPARSEHQEKCNVPLSMSYVKSKFE